MSDSQEEVQEIELECTCDDLSVILPCPVHFSESHQQAVDYKKNPKAHQGIQVHTMTDNDLMGGTLELWEGFLFKCHRCNHSRMHWMPKCPYCGVSARMGSTSVERYFAEQRSYRESRV